MALHQLNASSANATLRVLSGDRLRFNFAVDDASFERQGNDLNLRFAAGGTLVLQDFFVVPEGGSLPELVLLDGLEVSAVEFLEAFNPDLDLSTAAGPGYINSGGEGEYRSGEGALTSGVSRLGTGASAEGEEENAGNAGDALLADALTTAATAAPGGAVPEAPPAPVQYDARAVLYVDNALQQNEWSDLPPGNNDMVNTDALVRVETAPGQWDWLKCADIGAESDIGVEHVGGDASRYVEPVVDEAGGTVGFRFTEEGFAHLKENPDISALELYYRITVSYLEPGATEPTVVSYVMQVILPTGQAFDSASWDAASAQGELAAGGLIHGEWHQAVEADAHDSGPEYSNYEIVSSNLGDTLRFEDDVMNSSIRTGYARDASGKEHVDAAFADAGRDDWGADKVTVLGSFGAGQKTDADGEPVFENNEPVFGTAEIIAKGAGSEILISGGDGPAAVYASGAGAGVTVEASGWIDYAAYESAVRAYLALPPEEQAQAADPRDNPMAEEFRNAGTIRIGLDENGKAVSRVGVLADEGDVRLAASGQVAVHAASSSSEDVYGIQASNGGSVDISALQPGGQVTVAAAAKHGNVWGVAADSKASVSLTADSKVSVSAVTDPFGVDTSAIGVSVAGGSNMKLSALGEGGDVEIAVTVKWAAGEAVGVAATDEESSVLMEAAGALTIAAVTTGGPATGIEAGPGSKIEGTAKDISVSAKTGYGPEATGISAKGAGGVVELTAEDSLRVSALAQGSGGTATAVAATDGAAVTLGGAVVDIIADNGVYGAGAYGMTARNGGSNAVSGRAGQTTTIRVWTDENEAHGLYAAGGTNSVYTDGGADAAASFSVYAGYRDGLEKPGASGWQTPEASAMTATLGQNVVGSDDPAFGIGQVSLNAYARNAAYGMQAADGGVNAVRNAAGVDVLAEAGTDTGKAYGLHASGDGRNLISASSVAVTALSQTEGHAMHAEVSAPGQSAVNEIFGREGGPLAATISGTHAAMFASGSGAVNRILGASDSANPGAGDSISLRGDMLANEGGINEIISGGGNDSVFVDGNILDESGERNNRIATGEGNDIVTITGSMEGGYVEAGTGDDSVYIHGYVKNSVVKLGTDDTNANWGSNNTLVLGREGVTEGQDVLQYGAFIYGSAGNDYVTLHGNMDGGQIELGWGNDTVEINGSMKWGSIDMGAYNDRLAISGDMAAGTYIHMGEGVDTVTISGELGGIVSLAEQKNASSLWDKDNFNAEGAGSNGNPDWANQLYAGSIGEQGIVYGSNGIDSITVQGDMGGSIYAGAGNDVVTVKGAVEGGRIEAGTGNDSVYIHGYVKDSVVKLGTDDTNANWGSNNTLVLGREGVTENEDVLQYGAYIYGSAGNDYITLHGNMDGGQIELGWGNDTVEINGDMKWGSIDMGAYNDRLTISGDMAEGTYIHMGEGVDTVTINGELNGIVSLAEQKNATSLWDKGNFNAEGDGGSTTNPDWANQLFAGGIGGQGIVYGSNGMDKVMVQGVMRDGGTIETGAGMDTVSLLRAQGAWDGQGAPAGAPDPLNEAKILTGSGNTINTGADADIIEFYGGVEPGSVAIDGGDGIDRLVLKADSAEQFAAYYKEWLEDLRDNNPGFLNSIEILQVDCPEAIDWLDGGFFGGLPFIVSDGDFVVISGQEFWPDPTQDFVADNPPLEGYDGSQKVVVFLQQEHAADAGDITLGSGHDAVHIEPGGEAYGGVISALSGDDVILVNVDLSGRILAGDGNDLVTINGDCSGLIVAGAGSDQVSISGKMNGGQVSLGEANTAEGGDAGDVNTLVIGSLAGLGSVLDSGDWLYGSIGADDVTLNGDMTGGQASLGGGSDKMTVNGNLHWGTVDMGAGDDSLLVNGDITGNAQVRLGSGSDRLEVGGGIHTASILMGGAGDTGDINTLIAASVHAGAAITGSGGTDILEIGSFAGGTIDLGGGNDAVSIGSMTDAAWGGPARLILGDGDIGQSNSLVIGADGEAGTVFSGYSYVTGSGGDDAVTMNGKMDGGEIRLGDGDDLFTANGSLTWGTVDMGAGNDTVVIDASNGASLGAGFILNGGDGLDTLEFRGDGLELSLSQLTQGNHVTGFETINLDEGAQSLDIDALLDGLGLQSFDAGAHGMQGKGGFDAASLNGLNVLVVNGDGQDTVSLTQGGAWNNMTPTGDVVESGDGTLYTVVAHDNGLDYLLVAQEITLITS